MTLKCYTITDESNKINKTLGTSTDFTGTLREPSSVENPVIQIQSSSIISMNYAYVTEFGRYYYIVDKKMDGPTLCTLTLKVDVLMSYASSIMNTPMLIERSESMTNPYLNDNQRAIINNPMTLTKKFPTSFDAFTFYLTTSANA